MNKLTEIVTYGFAFNERKGIIMKRLFSYCLSIIVLLSALIYMPATVEAAKSRVDDSGNFEYVCHGKYAAITKYLGTIRMDAEEIYTLPSKLDGYIVNEIGEGAFEKFSAPTSHLIIPDTVSTIDDKAFYFETDEEEDPVTKGVRLKSVELPESLVYLGEWAFTGNSITEVRIPGSVRFLGENCLGFALESVVVDDGVRRINDRAFAGNSSLRNITLPTTLTKIGTEAFAGAGWIGEKGNVQLAIPDAVTEIGDGAFKQCWKLSSVKLGAGIQVIGAGAFSGCMNLEKMDISSCGKLYKIGKEAFSDCERLKSFSVNPAVEELTIGERAFYGCSALRTVTVPDCTLFEKKSVGYVYSKAAQGYVLTDKLKVKVISSGFYKPSRYYTTSQSAVYSLYQNVGLKACFIIKSSDTGEMKFNDKTSFRLFVSGNSGLKWKSSNPKVASISTGGTVKTLKGGTTVLTTTLNDGTKYSCKLKVLKVAG